MLEGPISVTEGINVQPVSYRVRYALTAPGSPRGGHYARHATVTGQSSSITDRMFPAGSVNQAISGPSPRKMPFSSVSRSVPV